MNHEICPFILIKLPIYGLKRRSASDNDSAYTRMTKSGQSDWIRREDLWHNYTNKKPVIRTYRDQNSLAANPSSIVGRVEIDLTYSTDLIEVTWFEPLGELQRLFRFSHKHVNVTAMITFWVWVRVIIYVLGECRVYKWKFLATIQYPPRGSNHSCWVT